jgi:hypothetical protein
MMLLGNQAENYPYIKKGKKGRVHDTACTSLHMDSIQSLAILKKVNQHLIELPEKLKKNE